MENLNDTNGVTLLYPSEGHPYSMNRQWVSVLAVLTLVVLAAPSSGGAPPAASVANDSSLGTSISSFVQVSTVEAEAEVDREMFSAALADAPNDAVRRRLLERRSEELSRRLDSVRQSLGTNDSDDRRPSVERSVAAARVDALERSVTDVGELANRAEVAPPGFDRLRENVRGLREPPTPPVVDTGDDLDLGPPSDSPGNGEGKPGAGDGERANGTRNTGAGGPTPPNGAGTPNDGDGALDNPGDGNGTPDQSGGQGRANGPTHSDVPNQSEQNRARTPVAGQGTGPNDSGAGAADSNAGASVQQTDDVVGTAGDASNDTETSTPRMPVEGGESASAESLPSPRSAVTVLPTYD